MARSFRAGSAWAPRELLLTTIALIAFLIAARARWPLIGAFGYKSDHIHCPYCFLPYRHNLDLSSVHMTQKERTNDVRIETVLGANHTLVAYNFYAHDGAETNLRFFLDHGLYHSPNTHFLLVLSSAPQLQLPTAPNLHVLWLTEDCYGFGALKAAIEMLSLAEKFEKFVLTGTWSRGPFLPLWSRLCWTTAFLRPLDDKTHLVGTSFGCVGPDYSIQPHLRPISFGVSKEALPAALSSFSCPITGALEFAQSQTLIFENVKRVGLGVSAHSAGWSETSLADCPVRWPYNPHPYESIFVNPRLSPTLSDMDGNRNKERSVPYVKVATDAADLSGYDSQLYCA